MKKALLFKKIVVAALSIILIVSLSSIVLADDNNTSYDGWDDPGVPVVTTNTGNTGTTTNATENVTTNTFTNIETNSDTSASNTGNATTRLDTNSADDEDNEVNSLAYTGIEDNSVLAVVIVLGLIVAVYSFKKVKEYNSL